MKTLFSDVEYAKIVDVLMQHDIQTNLPCILFKKKKKKIDKDDDDDEKMKTKAIKIRIDPNDAESDQMEVKMEIFEDGDAKDWICWRIQLNEILRDVPVTDRVQKTKMAKSLQKGKMRDSFGLHHLTNLVTDADGDEQDAEIFNRTLDNTRMQFFPTQNAWRRQ
jgi:hypothetical protein